MSLSLGEEGCEDKTGGWVPAVRHRQRWTENMTLELLVRAETSCPIIHLGRGICQFCRFIFDWKFISKKTIFGMQPVFPSPPNEPHPPPTVLRGLLATQEAVLEVRRTGPGPSVSPRLKGSGSMENWMQHKTQVHTKAPKPQTTAEAPPYLTPYIRLCRLCGRGIAYISAVICAI